MGRLVWHIMEEPNRRGRKLNAYRLGSTSDPPFRPQNGQDGSGEFSVGSLFYGC